MFYSAVGSDLEGDAKAGTGGMKIEVDDEELKLIIEALEHLAAYRKVKDREYRPLQELADRLKREGKRKG